MNTQINFAEGVTLRLCPLEDGKLEITWTRKGKTLVRVTNGLGYAVEVSRVLEALYWESEVCAAGNFEHYWSLIEQSGEPKVAKAEAKAVWDATYPPFPKMPVTFEQCEPLNLDDLKELRRMLSASVSYMENDGPMIDDPRYNSAPYNIILGGKWGIKKLKP